ncbi:nipped-B-like protein isoform X1 [Sycon ciliatum]|uniref:nipped-B-like protein isoform X1 n=1 Tax=Sycon ciliatum TaxID=27933 RepID=UPI0031F71FE9
MDAASQPVAAVRVLPGLVSLHPLTTGVPFPLTGLAAKASDNAVTFPPVDGSCLQQSDARMMAAVANALSGVSSDFVNLKHPPTPPGTLPPAFVQDLVRNHPQCFSSCTQPPPGTLTPDQTLTSESSFQGQQCVTDHEGRTVMQAAAAPGVRGSKSHKRRHAESSLSAATVPAASAPSVAATSAPSVAAAAVPAQDGASKKKKKRKQSVSSEQPHAAAPSAAVPAAAASAVTLQQPTVQLQQPTMKLQQPTVVLTKVATNIANHAETRHVEASTVSQPPQRKASRSKSSDSTSSTSSDFASKPKQKSKRKHNAIVHHELSSGPNTGFTAVLEDVFEHADRHNLLSVTGSADGAISPQLLLPGPFVTQIGSKVRKLGANSELSEHPVDELARLLCVMDKHVLDCLTLQLDSVPDDCDGEPAQWRALAKDRLQRGLDAALVMLHISTSPGVTSNVYQEEHIERLVQMIGHHLTATVFPEFDNYYQLSGHKKEGVVVSKMKRGRANADPHKDIIPLYNKICELLTCLAQFIEVHKLPDALIVLVSSMAISTFFVENVSTLQLSALHVIRSIFSRYTQHQQVIFSDIFESLSRLPSSKQSLRSYRLSGDIRIQMVTALVLQLVESTVSKPLSVAGAATEKKEVTSMEEEYAGSAAMEERKLQVSKAFDCSRQSVGTFLSSFLKKCHTKEENDFRPLFGNFVQDILVCLYSAEWPAAQIVIDLLLPLLTGAVSKSSEMSTRVVALDHMGSIAARARKQCMEMDGAEPIQSLVAEIRSKLADSDCDRDEQDDFLLRRVFIEQLHFLSMNDPACRVAKDYHLSRWLCQAYEKQRTLLTMPEGGDNEDLTAASAESLVILNKELEDYCDFLYALAASTDDGKKPKRSRVDLTSEQLDRIGQHLVNDTVHTFEYCLVKILVELADAAATVRTKAMKALSVIVNCDPSLLAKEEVQNAVHARLKDPSTSMREATVDLIGKFVLLKPDLTLNYYRMLSDRISDAGVSVRKRVIKTMRDICIQQPDFKHVPDICLLMIRCLKEEDSTKALVRKVFEEMWFCPFTSKELESTTPSGVGDGVLLRVKNIVKAVAISSKDTHEWIEKLLKKMLRVDEEDEKNTSSTSIATTRAVCQTLVDCLVKHMLVIEETSSQEKSSKSAKAAQRLESDQLLPCIWTLCLFVRADPHLAVSHAPSILPYLDMSWENPVSIQLSCYVSEMLQAVLPLLEHPSPSFLANMEERLAEMMFVAPQAPIVPAIGCLSVIVNKVTHNYKFIYETFRKFYDFLYSSCKQPNLLTQGNRRALALRSVLCVGALCRYFDHSAVLNVNGEIADITEKVFRLLMGLVQRTDGPIRMKSLAALGHFFMGKPDMMVRPESEKLYTSFLDSKANVELTTQVLRNMSMYLAEDEVHMTKQAEKRKAEKKQKASSQENGDAGQSDKLVNWDSQSHVSSSIAQVYLKSITCCMLHKVKEVRSAALHVIGLVFSHGLVHPYEFVPHLIAMNADVVEDIRVQAKQQLVEFDKKNPGFLSTVAFRGFQKGYELRSTVSQDDRSLMRGLDHGKQYALLSHVYTLVRGNRQQRRGFILSLLRMFQDPKVNGNLPLLLFTADNLAGFPYSLQEEPLFVVHHLAKISSIAASDAIQHFKEVMGVGKQQEDEDDWLDVEYLKGRREGRMDKLRQCYATSKGAMLLLCLKEHLKELYGLSDAKCSQYAPSDKIKGPEKPSNPRPGVTFHPATIVSLVTEPELVQAQLSKDDILLHFIQLHRTMSAIERAEDEQGDVGVADEDDHRPQATVAAASASVQPGGEPAVNGIASEEIPAAAPPAAVAAAPISRHSRMSRSESSNSKKSTGKKRRKRDSTSDSDAQSVKSASSRGVMKRKRRRLCIVDSDEEDDDSGTEYLP